jgi:transmembrane 9 superfamily protein 3
MKGQLWIKQLIVGAFLVPAIICGVAFLVNFISIYYGSSRSIPFTVMVSLKFRFCNQNFMIMFS